MIYAYNVTDVADYGRTYCYTGGGYEASISRGSVDGTAANVYRCKEDETLKSVGVYTTKNNQKVKINVYVSDDEMTVPTQGTLQSSLTVEDTGIMGYHVLDLTTPVSLTKNQYFSVMVTWSNPDGTTAMIPIESTKNTKSLTGQTFYATLTSAGTSWVDSNAKSMNGKGNVNNACIYGYTSDDDNAELKASLSTLLTQAKSLDQDSVTAIAGEDNWNLIQTEAARAEKVLANGQAALLTKEVRLLQRTLSFSSSRNLYADAKMTTGAGSAGVDLYQNGGSVKIDGVSVNTKKKVLYVDMEKTQSLKWTNKKKGYTAWVTKGKYVAAVTSTLTKPTLNTDGTLASKDTAAENIVTAKASGSKVTITTKNPGDVYVWVLYYPQSVLNQEGCLANQTDFAVTKVHVGVAPKNVSIYADSQTNPTDATQVQYTSDIIPEGESVDVYLKGTIGKASKKENTLQEIATDDITYFATVPTKFQDYISVTQDTADTRHFTVQVASGILAKMKVKSGKTLSVSIPFACSKNGKKATFKLVISNPVKKMTLTGAGEAASQVTTAEDTGIVEVKLPSAATAASELTLEETTELYLLDLTGTDASKVFAMATADGFSFSKTSTITVTAKPSKTQKKISLAAVKKQTGKYTVKASKGTPSGTEAYFILWHNSYTRSMGAGYQVIHVTVE
jgi:hypothetical protein